MVAPQVGEAFNLIKDMEPSTPPEFILKAVVHAMVGQANGNAEHVKQSQQYYQLVGASASECDTIPGRQCMASCFFLLKQFEDVLVFLNSIKTYFINDDDFNWNYGSALAATGAVRACTGRRWQLDAHRALCLEPSSLDARNGVARPPLILHDTPRLALWCCSPLSLPCPTRCFNAESFQAKPWVHAAPPAACGCTHFTRRQVQAGGGDAAAAAVRQVPQRVLLPRVARALLHHERQGAPGVGTLPAPRHVRRDVPPAAAHRQRLLPHGRVLLRGQGARVCVLAP